MANHYLGMRSGDLDNKPYAKYWRPDMKPMQKQVVNALLHGTEAWELAFDLDNAEELLKPGYLPLETGYTHLANGQTFIAVYTEMPGVTGPMFEWWMGWHYMEHQRYKLWHPRAHVANGTNEMQGDNPNITDKQKYMTTHYVTEYIGNRLERIAISFSDPKEYFAESSDLTVGNTSALVCGRVDLQRVPITLGYLIHQIRKINGGSEMRSRFWLGKPEIKNSKRHDLRNSVLGSKLFRRLLLPKDIGAAMLVHCGMEMNHLAGFLPDLYDDYHPEPR